MRTKALALEAGMLNGPYNEEKGIRRVRTPAGAKRFGQPIGSIIIADGVGGAGKKLTNLKIVDSEYEGFDKVKGKNGKVLYIGKYDGERNYTVNDADDNELYSARSLEDAFKWADKNSAPKGSTSRGKSKTDAPSKADVDKFTALTERLLDRTGELARKHKAKLHGSWSDYLNNDSVVMDIQDQLDEIMERYGQEAEWRGGFWHYPSPEAFAGDSGSAPKSRGTTKKPAPTGSTGFPEKEVPEPPEDMRPIVKKFYEERNKPPRHADGFEGMLHIEMMELHHEQKVSHDSDEIYAIEEYVGEGYAQINDYLRGHIDPEIREFYESMGGFTEKTGRALELMASQLSGAIRKYTVSKPVLAHRVVDIKALEGMNVGDTIKDNAFVSTSMSEAYVSSNSLVHLEGKNLAKAEVRIPAGVHGLYVSGILDFGKHEQYSTGEQELLLDRGMSFKVIDKDENSKPPTLILEAIPQVETKAAKMKNAERPRPPKFLKKPASEKFVWREGQVVFTKLSKKEYDMGHQYKTVTLAGMKADHEAEGVVETFVAITGIKDNVNDIIMPGAFQKSLVKRVPKGVWHHNITESVSKTLAVDELEPGHKSLPKTLPNGDPWPAEAGGLLVKTMFNLNTQRGRDAYEDVKFFGTDQEWSIGYNVPTGGATIDRKTGVRKIHHLDLYEYSPVLFGAMPNARTVSVKSAQLAWKQLDGLSEDSILEFKNLLAEVESKSLDDYSNFNADDYESKADDTEADIEVANDDPIEEEQVEWDDDGDSLDEKSFYNLTSADLLTIEKAMAGLNELKELMVKAKIDPSKKFKKKKTIDEEAEDDGDEKVVTKKVKKKVVDEDAEDDTESDDEEPDMSEDDPDAEEDADGEGEDADESDAKVASLVEAAGLDVPEEAQSFDNAVGSNDIQVMEESGSLILDAVEEALNKGDADKPALEELAGYIASAFQAVGADGDPNTTEDQGGSDEEEEVEEEATKKKIVKKHDPFLTMEGKAAYLDYDFGYQLKRRFDQDTRNKLADNGHALPDGSFPIENESDLKNAIKALGRSKNKTQAKSHIEKRAKALGKTDLLPDGWADKALMEKDAGFVLDTKSILAALEDL